MSPRAAVNAREPTLPLCGPGYALLMIGYFLVGSKFVGTEHHAVEIRRAVGGLDLDRNRRLPTGRDELRDVGLLERQHELAVGVAQRDDAAATSGFEYVSTRYLPSGDSCIV